MSGRTCWRVLFFLVVSAWAARGYAQQARYQIQQDFTDAGAGLALGFQIGRDMPHDVRPEAGFQVRNTSNESRTIRLRFQLQRDSELLQQPPPDLTHGQNIAWKKPSRSYQDGRLIAENTLTDGLRHVYAATPWGEGRARLHQIIDLEQSYEIRHLRYTPSDANWARFVNVLVSESGEDGDFIPVPELQDIPLERKWGVQDWPEFAPVNARYIRLEYHNKGGGIEKTSMAGQIEVFSSPENHLESWMPPQTGATIFTFEEEVRLAAGEERSLSVAAEHRPGPGMYLFAWQAGYTTEEGEELTYRGHFGHTAINLPPFEDVRSRVHNMPHEKRRYGMNMGNPRGIARLADMGISAVRFENHKWDMISPASGEYRFDGSVPPWRVPHDRYYEMFARYNMMVLPYLFHTPPHYSRAPSDARRPAQHPPEDLSRFSEFAFQTAARYGAEQHSAERLLSSDQQSGLGLLNTYSLWNEPNLNNPYWGHFIGSMEEYFEMFRHGALGIRRADPQARIATAGFAGTDTVLLDKLLQYEYDDGSHPADYADILNVHDYTGRQPPETARIDTNADRGDDATPGLSFEERLQRLVHWRNYRLPGRPVWLTETGYDTGGEQGISRRQQAQRIPRLLQIALGSGIDKVFLYRITGDRPSKYAASGIWDGDAIPKPSHYSLATLIHQTDGYDEVIRLPHPDERVWIYAWRHDGHLTLSAWAVPQEGATEAPKLGLSPGEATLTDSFGYARTAQLTEAFELSEFPVYISGMSSAAEAVIEEQLRIAEEQKTDYMQRRNRMAASAAPGWNIGATPDEKPAAFDFGRPRYMKPVPCTESSYFDSVGVAEDKEISRSERDWLPETENRTGCRMPAGSAFHLKLPRPEGALMLETALRGRGAEVEIRDENSRVLHQKTYDTAALESADGEETVLRERLDLQHAAAGELALRIQFSSYGGELHWLRAWPETPE